MDKAWQVVWQTCNLLAPVKPSQEEQINACSKIISRGESGSPNKTVYGNAFYFRGQAYCDSGQFARGLADITQAIDYTLMNHAYDALLSLMYSWRAGCFVKNRQYNQATEDINNSFERDPRKSLVKSKDDWMMEFRGDIALAMGAYDKAVKYYEAEFQAYSQKKGLSEKLAAARQYLAALEAAAPSAQPTAAPPAELTAASPAAAPSSTNPVAQERRVALVIGNSAYKSPRLVWRSTACSGSFATT